MRQNQLVWMIAAVCALGTLAAATAQATTWNVPVVGGPCTVGTPDCDDIAEALAAAAASGDTIQIAAGVIAVPATIIINKSITISGAGLASTTVAPAGAFITFDIAADGIVIQDLTILGGTTGVRFPGASDDTDITRVKFMTNTSRGVEISPPAATPVTTVTITDSQFETAGIGLRMASNSTVSGLSISGTSFTGNTYHIYQANDGATSTLSGLAISNSTFSNHTSGYGIYLEEIRDSTIADSMFSGGDNHIGILKFYSTNMTPVANVAIRGNQFSSFTGNAMDIEMIGMALGTPGITIEDNTITKSVATLTRAGAVFLRLHPTLDNGQVDFIDNTITATGVFGAGTAVHGVQLRGNGPVSFTGNVFDGGNVGGTATNPPSSGIFIQSRSGTTFMPATTVITASCNRIQGFQIGVSVFDSVAAAYGGLPVGASVTLTDNAILGNDHGVVNGMAPPTVDAEDNYWGCPAGPTDPACDDVVGDVDADPFRTVIAACVPCAANAECDDAQLCNGAETCTMANTCAAGSPAASGTACTTNDVFCDGPEVCDGNGACHSSGDPCLPLPTNDANCATSCDEDSETCTANDPAMTACNDGLSCNGADSCVEGSCTQHASNCQPDIDMGQEGDEAVSGCGAPPNLGPTCIQIRTCGEDRICFNQDDMTLGTGGTDATGCFTIELGAALVCNDRIYAQDVCSMTFPVVGAIFGTDCIVPAPLLSPMMFGALLAALSAVALFGLRRLPPSMKP